MRVTALNCRFVDQGPSREVYTGRDAQAQGNSEDCSGHEVMESKRRKEDRDQNAALDQVDRLLKKVRSGNDAEEFDFRRIRGRQSGCKNQNRLRRRE